ncbi:hypothetical protein SAMN05444671_4379 [Flavobacterium sp. CF108]|uniref:hypothetical protein n=1 Tax=unclassified Flavobacterium TaxID=196869 RepID=UPI0008CD609D|nr:MULTISPECIES: hypothetical protein [unclassified Flavobacterium]SEO71988.1 hypothetical protein SAMN04487978_3527 [Flavobacterium sp. fv08]SHH93742.1 hypothetical protein SAMN05444671_4379 [Flavobacterium sp. CF108]
MEKIKDIDRGNLLTFTNTDNKYNIILCTSTNKTVSPHSYTFSLLDYNDIQKPTIETVKNLDFFGVGNMTKTNLYNYSDQDLINMWEYHPEIKPCLLGTYALIIWRKDFMKFRDNLEFIGNLDILINLDKNGNGGVNASSWDFLQKFFNGEIITAMNERNQEKFKLKAVIKSS